MARQSVTHEPSVLVAVMTEDGLRKSPDGMSFEIKNIGNAMIATPDENGLMEIPFYVLAVAGRAQQRMRLEFTLEYPDGTRGQFRPADSEKFAGTGNGAIEWFAGLTFPYRMSGVHWVKVSLNSAFKTKCPISILLDGEDAPVMNDGFQA